MRKSSYLITFKQNSLKEEAMANFLPHPARQASQVSAAARLQIPGTQTLQ